jgi:hypothetical protein
MERASRKKLIIAVAVLIWSVVTPFMWRDLRRRGPDQVRGPKFLWWIASTNLSGSVAYWLFGRTGAR